MSPCRGNDLRLCNSGDRVRNGSGMKRDRRSYAEHGPRRWKVVSFLHTLLQTSETDKGRVQLPLQE